MYLKRDTRNYEEFSKAYFPARNQKGTEATNGMMRLLCTEIMAIHFFKNYEAHSKMPDKSRPRIQLFLNP